jgi:hypothetical protein
MRYIVKAVGKGLIIGLAFIAANLSGQGLADQPMDSPQTLEWVVRQANRVDTSLSNAMRSIEPIEILLKLADCYTSFDAVALAGLYCTNVRAAAEAGRRQCDVINYRLEQDLNSKLQRAVEARRQAVLMRESAQVCLREIQQKQVVVNPAFLPAALIRQDAQLAQMDLADGIASQDLHILAQKVEHAIRLMHDIGHLAASLNDCGIPERLSEQAIRHCEAALSAPNWTEVHQEIKAATAIMEKIRQQNPCE